LICVVTMNEVGPALSADLCGLDDTERAHSILRIAAPEHKAALEAALG
jgi:acyl-CoA hydrolase